jgi:hypothetical protein
MISTWKVEVIPLNYTRFVSFITNFIFFFLILFINKNLNSSVLIKLILDKI